MDDFFERNDLPWIYVGSLCTDGAPVMIGAKSGFATFVENVPNTSFLFAVSLRWQAKPSENILKLVMKETIQSVNFANLRALNHRFFKILCKGMGSDHTAFFHSNLRWLSRHLILVRVYKLRVESQILL